MKVGIGDVVASYQEWCEGRDWVALSEGQFLDQFDKICSDELDRRVVKNSDEFEGMKLIRLIGQPLS